MERMRLITLFTLLNQLIITHAYPSKIPIQSFTTPADLEQGVNAVLNFTISRLNSETQNPFLLSYSNKALRTAVGDIWGVTQTVCAELEEGFMLMLVGNTQKHHQAYTSVANSMEIPLINWDLSPATLLNNPTANFEISLKPPNAELLADLIILKQWDYFVYMHDDDDAAQNIQQIYNHLQKVSNLTIKSEIVKMPPDVKEFSEFLMEFNIKRVRNNVDTHVIVDTSNAFRQQQILQAIRSAQFNQLNYHYVMANFDFLPYDVEMFQNGQINVTGFQILDRESIEYDHLKKFIHQLKYDVLSEHNADLQARLAFVHDAILVAKTALEGTLRRNDSLFHHNFRHGELYNFGFPGIFCYPNADRRNPGRPFTAFEHGKTILRELHSLRLTETEGALTGNIEFDRYGRRKNFLVTVIDLVSDSISSFNKKEVFAWKQSFGFLNNRTVAQHTRKPQETDRKKGVRVVTALVEPFVMIKRDCENSNSTECQGNGRFEGYCIDLLKLLNDRNSNFRYEIFIGKDNKYGVKQEDGSWDGLIGYLLRGDADAAVASLTINQDRERVVDFSKPYMTTGISIMIKKPDKQEITVFSFMQPLSTEIWMYIIFAYVGVSVVIFLVSRFSPYEWRVEEMANGGFTISNDFSVYNCLWFTLAAFMQQGTDILPRSISGRIASSAWWFFTMIIVSSYTANLAAFLTLEKMQAPIESVEDLAKQTKIKYGIQQGGSTAQFFKFSTVQTYQRMWRFMDSQVPSVFTNNYAEGIDRVRTHKGRYAFLLEATANEYANTRKPCDTMKVGANLNSVGYGVATPFGSEWKDDINLAILALQEKGELKKLENKWWYDRGQCEHGISDGSSSSLNLSKVAGIFYILIGGMVISMVAAVGEFLYRSRIEARKGQLSSIKNLRASFYGQLKLSMQGGAVVHEGSSAHDALKRHKASSLLPANYSEQSGIMSLKRNNYNDTNNTNSSKKNNGNSGTLKNSNKSRKPPLPQTQLKTYNTAV
ncbi:Glutamate receptor 1 [Aphelenchoides besseyi]|nr:Glutamate receptor 1 [Aphelenchoides besseyi]KAI6235142.1 Glutamate receptor 1 [Aphelenchoides besseyi]